MLSGGNTAVEAFAPAMVNALPSRVVDSLNKAKTCWLKNTELAKLLRDYQHLGFCVSAQAPYRPPSESMHTRLRFAARPDRTLACYAAWLSAGGSVFLFDRTTLRFFRKDGYRWRKKADGRTIREAHEKLKVTLSCYAMHRLTCEDFTLVSDTLSRAILELQVENQDVLNCYYAQSEEADGLQVCSYRLYSCCIVLLAAHAPVTCFADM